MHGKNPPDKVIKETHIFTLSELNQAKLLANHLRLEIVLDIHINWNNRLSIVVSFKTIVINIFSQTPTVYEILSVDISLSFLSFLEISRYDFLVLDVIDFIQIDFDIC